MLNIHYEKALEICLKTFLKVLSHLFYLERAEDGRVALEERVTSVKRVKDERAEDERVKDERVALEEGVGRIESLENVRVASLERERVASLEEGVERVVNERQAEEKTSRRKSRKSKHR